MDVVINDDNRKILEHRLSKHLALTLEEQVPYKSELTGLAVESTFNSYRLVDGSISDAPSEHSMDEVANACFVAPQFS